MPKQILSHQTLGVQFYAVQNDFLEFLITCPIDKVTAMEILRLVIHDPCGKFLPVFQYTQDYILGGPVEEHFAGTGRLTAGAATQNHPIELSLLAGPGAGGTGAHTLTAAYTAAGVLLHLADGRIGRQNPGGAVLAGPHAGAACDAAFGVICHARHADNTEIAHMSLVAVIGAAGDVDLDVVVAGEDDGLNLPGQLKGIAVVADAVVIADAGGDIAGADGGVTINRIPGMRFVCNGVHVNIAHLGIHFFDIRLQVGIDRRDVFIGDTGNVKGLPGAEVKVAVAPGFGDVLHIAEILGVYRTAGNAHLQHKFSGYFGLPVAVQPDLFEVNIVIHLLAPPFSVHQIPGHRIGEYRAIKTHIYFVNAAMATFSHRTGHFALEAHPDLFRIHSLLYESQSCEFHHGRRTHHHNGIVAAEGVKGDFRYKGCDQACAPPFQGAVIQSVNSGKLFLPFFQFAVEHDAVSILEPADQMNRPGVAGSLGQHMKHGTDGSQAGAAGDDHQMLVLELLHWPALAVRASQEQSIAGLFLEDDIGDLTHGADGKLEPAVTLG